MSKIEEFDIGDLVEHSKGKAYIVGFHRCNKRNVVIQLQAHSTGHNGEMSEYWYDKKDNSTYHTRNQELHHSYWYTYLLDLTLIKKAVKPESEPIKPTTTKENPFKEGDLVKLTGNIKGHVLEKQYELLGDKTYKVGSTGSWVFYEKEVPTITFNYSDYPTLWGGWYEASLFTKCDISTGELPDEPKEPYMAPIQPSLHVDKELEVKPKYTYYNPPPADASDEVKLEFVKRIYKPGFRHSGYTNDPKQEKYFGFQISKTPNFILETDRMFDYNSPGGAIYSKNVDNLRYWATIHPDDLVKLSPEDLGNPPLKFTSGSSTSSSSVLNSTSNTATKDHIVSNSGSNAVESHLGEVLMDRELPIWHSSNIEMGISGFTKTSKQELLKGLNYDQSPIIIKKSKNKNKIITI